MIETHDLITLALEWDLERAHLEKTCGPWCRYCEYEAEILADYREREAERAEWLHSRCPGCGKQHGCRCQDDGPDQDGGAR